METYHKLLIVTAGLVLLLAAGLWQFGLQNPTDQGLPSVEQKVVGQKIVREPKTVGPVTRASSSEHILVQFLGKPVIINNQKAASAAQLFLSIAQASPDVYGTITREIAEDNIRQAMQITAIALANYSNIDLACESAVDLDTTCERIDKNYKESRLGFPSHFEYFPASDGYECKPIRALAKMLSDISSGNCAGLENPELMTACNGISNGCAGITETGHAKSICIVLSSKDVGKCPLYAGFYPCPLLVAVHAAAQGVPCTQTAKGMQAYLCMGIVAKDCMKTYTAMIEDYTYAELGLETGNTGFCSLVEEPSIMQGCISGDKETVRKDLEKGYD